MNMVQSNCVYTFNIGVPGVAGVPGVPGLLGVPAVPGVLDVPDVPGVSDVLDVPDVPSNCFCVCEPDANEKQNSLRCSGEPWSQILRQVDVTPLFCVGFVLDLLC